MADLSTIIQKWRTTEAVNVPKDGVNINNASVNEYSTLANAIRDIKGVLKSESQNLGWDPGCSVTNANLPLDDGAVQSTNLRFIYANANSIIIKPFFSKWMRGVEGQRFILTVRQNGDTPSESPKYAYYTGYVSATKARYNSGDANSCLVYVTGLYRWTREVETDVLTRVSVDEISSADITKINDGNSEDPPVTTTSWDVHLDFSSYAPMQNLGYTSQFAPQGGSQWPQIGSIDSNPPFIDPCPLPARFQKGHMLTKQVGKGTAVFPYPEIDTNYSVTLTPTSFSDSSTDSAAFITKNVKKSKSFFTVEFGGTLPDSDDTINWDWEITRNY